MAAGGTSGRDFGTRAQHGVGARHLLCRNHSFELEIRLYHPHCFLNPDYSVFDCGRVALGEAEVRVTIEVVPLLQDIDLDAKTLYVRVGKNKFRPRAIPGFVGTRWLGTDFGKRKVKSRGRGRPRHMYTFSI